MNLILKRHFFGDEDEKKLAIFLYQVSGNVTIFSKHDKGEKIFGEKTNINENEYKLILFFWVGN
jgi:hypothetical protein